MVKTIAITSGKGGVGKTNLCANLAIQLAEHGHRVCIFDADFGTANINILLGVYPQKTIADVILHGIPLHDIIIKNHHGIDIIPGSSGVEAMANLESANLESILKSFSLLDTYDFILFDTGAGVAKNVVSFCLAATELIVVIAPEPTSLTDAYSLLKILCMNGLDRPVQIIVNHCRDLTVAKQAYVRFKEVVTKYLYVNIRLLGLISEDAKISDAVRRQRPFISLYPDTSASKCIRVIAKNFLQSQTQSSKAAPSITSFWQQCLGVFKSRLKLSLVRNDKKLVQRKYRRFPLGLVGQYSFNGKNNGECRLCDISAEGMAIQLYPDNTITSCNNLKVSICLPSKPDPVCVLLNVKWTNPLNYQKQCTCMAGGVLTFSDTHAKKNLLEYAYNNWFRSVA